MDASQGDIRHIFRPFNMNAMENVSILFADIVGFTKMSSNKTASQLVGLLNDLFGRFDYLCNHLGCEKISTLGDCYYCVSGESRSRSRLISNVARLSGGLPSCPSRAWAGVWRINPKLARCRWKYKTR